ncbi:MAG TPA: zf-HC2 domain-containing protein [Gammaproteobacteria bacterium]
MVNCRHFRSQWSRFWFNQLEPTDSARMRRHLKMCRRCKIYDRQMQAVIDSLKGLVPPRGDDPEFIERLFDRSYHQYQAASRNRRAIVATLLAGFVGGALFWGTISRINGDVDSVYAKSISLPIASVKVVTLAVDSDRSVNEVRFTIELPDGIEIAGYPGQTRLSWEGRLEAGLNRLTLPLIAHREAHEGVLKTRIEYAGGGQELTLPLQPSDGSAALHSVIVSTG